MKASRVSSVGRLLAVCSAAALVAFSVPASALTVPFSSGNLSGSATLTAGTGTVSIVLTNTTSPTTSIADLISDLSFSVTGGQTIGTTQTVTPTGSLITCTDGQAGCVSASGTANQWYYGMNGSVGSQGVTGTGTYLLTALVGKNRSLIIGDSSFSCKGPGNKCPDGLGNGVNQPYLSGSGSFSLTIPGVTTDSTFSNVQLSFGTTPETVVPIPAAVWLFGSGLLGLIGIARRRITGALAPTPAMA